MSVSGSGVDLHEQKAKKPTDKNKEQKNNNKTVKTKANNLTKQNKQDSNRILTPDTEMNSVWSTALGKP